MLRVTSATQPDAGPPADPVIAASVGARHRRTCPSTRTGRSNWKWPRPSGWLSSRGRHLIVQAGTGTGKSLAYLVPALALGKRVVVSTATKALQDQLAHRDLPQLSRSLGMRFSYAVLKGRSNYVCRQRVEELSGGSEQLLLGQDDGFTGIGPGGLGPLGREVRRLVSWAKGDTAKGDRGKSGSPRIWLGQGCRGREAKVRPLRATGPSWHGSRATRPGCRSARAGESAREQRSALREGSALPKRLASGPPKLMSWW